MRPTSIIDYFNHQKFYFQIKNETKQQKHFCNLLSIEFCVKGLETSECHPFCMNELMFVGQLGDVSITNKRENIEALEQYSRVLSVVREKEDQAMLTFGFSTHSPLEESFPGYDNEIGTLPLPLTFQRLPCDPYVSSSSLNFWWACNLISWKAPSWPPSSTPPRTSPSNPRKAGPRTSPRSQPVSVVSSQISDY